MNIRTAAYILAIALWGCKGHGNALLPPDMDGTTMVGDRARQMLKDVEAYAQSRKNPEQQARLYGKARDVDEEVREAGQYIDRWRERLMEAGGGKDGSTTLPLGNDTLIATRLMALGTTADTLRWHIDEIRDVFVRQVKDTAALIAVLPENIAEGNGPAWGKKRFYHVTVYQALDRLKAIKDDITAGELVTLGKVLAEAKKGIY